MTDLRPAALRRRTTRSRPTPRDLAPVTALMAVAAGAGAAGLLTGSIDLGAAITARLPLASPVLAGVALGVVVAVPMAVTAVAAWRRSPATAGLAVLAGGALIGWIVVEVAVIRSYSWLQPACALYGLVVAALGLLLRRTTRQFPGGAG